MAEPSDEREARAREELWARDIMPLRSRLKGSPHPEDRGGYMLVDVAATNVIAGAKFELDLDDVESWISGQNT